MKKKTVWAALAAAVVAVNLAGCVPQAESKETETDKTTETEVTFNKEGLPITAQPVHYDIAGISVRNKNFKELEYFKTLEEETNVIIDWNMAASEAWSEKKSLLFAGSELPDAFYGQNILTDVDIIKYGSQGILIPLNDLIDTYAPNLKAVLDSNPEYRKQITAPDGNIYALPAINELNPSTYDKLFINKTWLDKLGLEVPETPEEFEAVLQAFKDNDMNGNGDTSDEIPFTFRYNSADPYNRQQGIQSMFGTFGQLDDIYHFVVNNGKVVYTPTTDGYRDAMNWFGSLYKKGLIDKEVFTHDANVYASKVQNPEKTVGVFMGWSRNSTAGNNKDDYIPMAPLKSSSGEQVWRTVDADVMSRGAFAITKQAEKPEILMRWIDQSYEPETSLEIGQGLLGRALEKTEDGGYRQMKPQEGMLLDTMIHDYSPGNSGVFAITQTMIDKLELNENLQERKELDEFYAPYNVPLENMYPNVFFTEEEIEEIGVLQTDIDAYVMKMYAQWIVEGGVDDWDGFQKQLEKMNVGRYIELYQKAYDRYVKAE